MKVQKPSSPHRRRGLTITAAAVPLSFLLVDGAIAPPPDHADGGNALEAESRTKPIIEHGDKEFRDLNENGELDTYEDWRKPTDRRVEDLLERMSTDQKTGMMVISTFNEEESRSAITEGRQRHFIVDHQALRRRQASRRGHRPPPRVGLDQRVPDRRKPGRVPPAAVRGSSGRRYLLDHAVLRHAGERAQRPATARGPLAHRGSAVRGGRLRLQRAHAAGHPARGEGLRRLRQLRHRHHQGPDLGRGGPDAAGAVRGRHGGRHEPVLRRRRHGCAAPGPRAGSGDRGRDRGVAVLHVGRDVRPGPVRGPLRRPGAPRRSATAPSPGPRPTRRTRTRSCC